MDGNPEGTSVEQIPGIGIIRARALKKAGWPTIESLLGVTMEELMSVRGLTEIKAAYILDYVRSLQPARAGGNGTARATRVSKSARPKVVVEPATPIEAARVEALPVDTEPVVLELQTVRTVETVSVIFTSEPMDEVVPVHAIQSPRDLMQDVALSAQMLLTCELSAKWDRPFSAQLGKLISLHEKWDRFEPIGKKQSKQVMELLQKMYRLLTETPIEELTRKKSQERLADILRDRRRRIRDILDG